MKRDPKVDMQSIAARKQRERDEISRALRQGKSPQAVAQENGLFSSGKPMPYRIDGAQRLA